MTEAFGVAILEAACAGLYVVTTRVGGVPEVLPEDMVSFCRPDEDGEFQAPCLFVPASKLFEITPDVVRALSEAIDIVSRGEHDPRKAHERVRGMYDWYQVAARTEVVYDTVMKMEPIDLFTRMQRFVLYPNQLCDLILKQHIRTMSLGRFVGPIFIIILVVDCFFFWFLEWLHPRNELDYVYDEWDIARFERVSTCVPPGSECVLVIC